MNKDLTWHYLLRLGTNNKIFLFEYRFIRDTMIA